MLHWSYTPEQKEEVKKALAAGVPKATILTYFYPEVTVEKMSSYRNKRSLKNRIIFKIYGQFHCGIAHFQNERKTNLNLSFVKEE